MKKISLKGISESLTKSEMKNVCGGSDPGGSSGVCLSYPPTDGTTGTSSYLCKNMIDRAEAYTGDNGWW